MTDSTSQTQPNKLHIEAAIPLPVYHTYSYTVPNSLICHPLIGKRVLVPFGNRQVSGYVTAYSKAPEAIDIKSVLDVLDEVPLFPESMIPFFNWIADYYVHPIGNVIKCALPGGLILQDVLTVGITSLGRNALESQKLTPIETAILTQLKPKASSLRSLYKNSRFDFPMSMIHNMKNRGLVRIQREMNTGRIKPKMERYVSIAKGRSPIEIRSQIKRNILELLASEKSMSITELNRVIPSASRHLNFLNESGHVYLSEKRVYRDPFGESIASDTAFPPTEEQAQVIKKIEQSFGKGFKTYLLAGVTGSGKTEIYLQLAEKALALEYAVLILVPEIALISQMEKRFRARFGECIALLHSSLSGGERYDQWIRIANHEVKIAIGTRSAIFAPFDNIGLIIVDEEHDTSYKQEGSLHYNARDLAVVRASQQNAVVLLGSATPSIQSYHNVMAKKYHLVTLTRRVEKRAMPAISLVDLREMKHARGTERIITPELYKAMKEVLHRKEQILLFLNRRGFASYPVCRVCGEAIRCKNCDISLTLHQGANAYKCHYCGYTQPSTTKCPACGSSKISLLGLGTEKIENTVKKLFPLATVKRMDRDTTVRKGSILSILKALKDGTIDILIGTQMIAKGHDFPNITLVGIICADLSLSFPDFRATERTFQLLAQVSGRAGRGEAPGRVILQTYNPDHFSISAAKKQDYKAFFTTEIGFRKTLNYPPFSRMILLKISGRDREKTGNHARHIADICRSLHKTTPSIKRDVIILGPIEAPVHKIANRYRWQILLKGLQNKPLKRFIKALLFENPSATGNPSVKLTVDVDPFFMM